MRVCFGGGFYVDPVFEPYQVRALVADRGDPDAMVLVEAELPPPEAIDYYGMLTPPPGRVLSVGASAIFGFRIQAFVTRAPVVGLTNVGGGEVQIVGTWRRRRHLDAELRPAAAPGLAQASLRANP